MSESTPNIILYVALNRDEGQSTSVSVLPTVPLRFQEISSVEMGSHPIASRHNRIKNPAKDSVPGAGNHGLRGFCPRESRLKSTNRTQGKLMYPGDYQSYSIGYYGCISLVYPSVDWLLGF